MLTWSPETDAEDLPNDLKKIINESWGVSRGLLVAEKEEKWHVHFIFSTSRSYNSDYKWWSKSISHLNYGAEFDLKYHDNFLCCAGGYCQKDNSRRIIARHNISDEQLLYGSQLYTKRLQRQKIRHFVDSFIVINPSKMDTAIGAMRAELGCGNEEAVIRLADAGFAFSSARPGYDEVYTRLYRNAQEANVVADSKMSL